MANMVLSFQPYLFRSAAALVGAVVALRVGPALSAIALKVGDALNGASVTRKPCSLKCFEASATGRVTIVGNPFSSKP